MIVSYDIYFKLYLTASVVPEDTDGAVIKKYDYNMIYEYEKQKIEITEDIKCTE